MAPSPAAPSPAAPGRALNRRRLRDTVSGVRMLAAHEAMRLLPSGLVSHLGGRLGRWVGPRFNGKVDGRIRAGVRALRPDLADDDAALDAAAARVWSAVGSAYAEFSVEDRLWGEGRVALEGGEHLTAALAGGRPLIVAGVHTGAWELLPITLGVHGRGVVSVVMPPRNPLEADIAERARRRAARRLGVGRTDLRFEIVAPSADAGFRLVAALRSGLSPVMFCDESLGGRVRSPRFGGEPSTEGNLGRIMRLARMTGADVLPGHVLRDPATARHVVRFLPPVPVRRTGAAAADLRENVAALNAVAAAVIREHLLQWYMLVDFSPDVLA